MEKKLIVAFLGTGNYREVDYLLDDQSYTTPFTQVALARHYRDQAHAGMRPDAMPGLTIQGKVEKLRRELERLLALG